MKSCLLASFLFLLFACSSESTAEQPASMSLYFPPNDTSTWETKPIAALGWNQNAVTPLLDYLELKHSKSFMILVDGKIVMEHYFNGHSAATPWYWASPGKRSPQP